MQSEGRRDDRACNLCVNADVHQLRTPAPLMLQYIHGGLSAQHNQSVWGGMLYVAFTYSYVIYFSQSMPWSSS